MSGHIFVASVIFSAYSRNSIELNARNVDDRAMARLLRQFPAETPRLVAKTKGEIMIILKLQRIVPALMVTCALGLTASPALAKKEGKTKIKGSEKTTAKENSGRQAGELPSGLQKYSDKNSQLPSGLQNKKDEDGQLTKGLTSGGKKLESTAKSSKPSK